CARRDYRANPDWHLAVRELTGGAGVDCVVEVGGPGTLARSLRCVAADGHLSLVGGLSTDAAPLEASAFNAFVGTIRRIAVGSRAQFVAMNRAIAHHKLRLVIDRVFGFREAADAFATTRRATPSATSSSSAHPMPHQVSLARSEPDCRPLGNAWGRR